MSSRRKRAPPVRVDEEAKKRLNWNMLDDRKNETIQDDDQTPTCSLLPADPALDRALLSHGEEDTQAGCSSSVRFAEELPGTSSDATSASASLSLAVVPVSSLSHIWKSLIGEFNVRPGWLPSDCEQRGFILHRMGDQLCLSYSSRAEGSDLQLRPDDEACTAECSLSRIPLEDLDWLQKRRVVQLCHQVKDESVKVRMVFHSQHNILKLIVSLRNYHMLSCEHSCLFFWGCNGKQLKFFGWNCWSGGH